jgi:hypothetical protein
MRPMPTPIPAWLGTCLTCGKGWIVEKHNSGQPCLTCGGHVAPNIEMDEEEG